MKVVILAGGLGTRLAEETEVRPKPMVEIGGQPILWHIMKQCAYHGLEEFVVALGYKGEVIKKFFVEYVDYGGDFTVDCRTRDVRRHDPDRDKWLVHLHDTGSATNTGGRLRRLRPLLARERFIVTYGDGVSDIDLGALLRFHESQGKLATVTAVRPPARYGGLFFDGNLVSRFTEKPQAGEGWINGGYIVMEPGALELLAGDETSLEADLLEELAKRGELAAFRHEGFWHCMDTLRDKRFLDTMWTTGRAPWRVWEAA